MTYNGKMVSSSKTKWGVLAEHYRKLGTPTVRHVCNHPEFHSRVRHKQIHHMYYHVHDVVAGSGENTFHLALSAKINEEYLKMFGSPQTQYQSVEHYPERMANPATFATHIEIVIVNQLYNIHVRMMLAGNLYPIPPGANTFDVLYSNEHTSTLRYSNS